MKTTSNTTATFNELTTICNGIARELHTICETRDYSKYGWASVAFMTDKFGGTYVNLHFDFANGIVTNWYGNKDAKVIKTEKQLKSTVTREMNKMIKARDLDGLYDFINSQY